MEGFEPDDFCEGELMEWVPMPLNPRRGSNAKGMKLPPIIPSGYDAWPGHRQSLFWNLFWALAGAGGYLPYGPDTWKLSGALTRARWDANCAAVLAAFEFTEPDALGSSAGARGSGKIFYRPLLEILEQQKRKPWNRRQSDQTEISEVSTVIHKETATSSISSSQSSFCFEREKEKEKKPQISEKLAARFEQERRDGLTRARKMGLRNFTKHPLEDWEKPESFAAAGD